MVALLAVCCAGGAGGARLAAIGSAAYCVSAAASNSARTCTAPSLADAVYDRDGINFDGGRIRVELSRGGRDRFDRGGSASRGGFHGRPPSDTGIRISGLPDRTSWQDLKDFARTAGDVNFAKMIGPDVGLVDFHSKSDFEAALPKLDGAIFKNRFGDEAKIRADPEVPFAPQGDSGPRGRSGSPGRYGPPPTHGSGDAGPADHTHGPPHAHGDGHPGDQVQGEGHAPPAGVVEGAAPAQASGGGEGPPPAAEAEGAAPAQGQE